MLRPSFALSRAVRHGLSHRGIGGWAMPSTPELRCRALDDLNLYTIEEAHRLTRARMPG